MKIDPLNPPSDSTPPSQSRAKSKRLLALLGISAIPAGLGMYFLQGPVGCACGDSTPNLLGAYLRSQQAHYIEHQAFTPSSEALSLPIPAETDKYRLTTQVATDRVTIYATPKEIPTDLFRLGLTKAQIPALVGAVVAQSQSPTSTTAILCVAEDTNLFQQPPTFDGEKFTCPNGFFAK
jgi:Type IV pilin-like G and H, putative